jgi:hypothetical protein
MPKQKFIKHYTVKFHDERAVPYEYKEIREYPDIEAARRASTFDLPMGMFRDQADTRKSTIKSIEIEVSPQQVPQPHTPTVDNQLF